MEREHVGEDGLEEVQASKTFKVHTLIYTFDEEG
jgi:hypothetical protein